MFILQQLAHVALDASNFGPQLLAAQLGSKLMSYDTDFLKPFANGDPEHVGPFKGLVAFSTSIDPDKGVRVMKVQGRDNWTKEDQKWRDKIDRAAPSRTALWEYADSIENALAQAEMGGADKIGGGDKKTIKKALKEVKVLLDDCDDAEKEDFDEKLKELQDTCSPIISLLLTTHGLRLSLD